MKSLLDHLFYSSLFPYLYFTAWLLLLILLSSGLYNRPPFFLSRNSYFYWLSIILLFVSRLPSILYAEQLNIDESQMIAQALTLVQNPVYWDSVDGTTNGPIDSYLLIWPGLLGLPINFLTARLTGTILISISLWYLFSSFRLLVSQTTARFGLLLLILFFSYTTHFDFLHYSSELAVLPLLSAVWFYFLRFNLQLNFARNPLNWLIAGILIGCVPYAKLQGIPPAALIGIAIATSIYRPGNIRFWPPDKRLWILITGFIVPTLLVTVLSACFGVLTRFYTFYIQSNIFNYSEYTKYFYPKTQSSIWARLLNLPFYFQYESTFQYLFLFFVSVSIVALLIQYKNRYPISRLNQWIGLWSLGWFAATLYSVAKPGTEFIHYLVLMLPPMVWLTVIATEVVRSSKVAWRFQAFPLAFLLCNVFILYNSFKYYQLDPAAANHYLHAFNIRHVHKNTAVSDSLLTYARTDDKLVVWGWNLIYHVETQLAQGTSENHSFRSIAPHSLRKAYQDKYIEDLKSTKPALFIDSSGPSSLWMKDTATYKYEKFAALGLYIAQRYQLINTVDQVRIYLRNDRVKFGTALRKQALAH